MNHKTVDQLLKESVISRDMARELLCNILKISQSKLFCDKKTIIVGKTEELSFESLQNKILKGVPLQYVVGRANFYGREFIVDKNVLIPRPETETLVLEALKFLELIIMNNESWREKNINIIDLGTGSGCVAISLASEIAKFKNINLKFKIFGVEISPTALRIAKINAQKYKSDIKFFKSDLFSNKHLPEKFDLILANLPYLKNNFLDENHNLKFEPRIALDGGHEGLEFILQLIKKLPQKLSKNKIAILEIDPRQERQLRQVLDKVKYKADFTKDMTGRIRFVRISL